MAAQLDIMMRAQLQDRRGKLVTAISATSDNTHLTGLLGEVDVALSRMDDGTFGLCEACHEAIEADRLSADPLLRFCLDHLTPPEQRALEQDLALAANIQSALLPRKDFSYDGWRLAYHYQPAGPVSGDYCDLVTSEAGDLYFMLGDVSGKGVAAAMLMAHLHAMFRALIGVGLPLVQLVERASRVFCESTLASHYATLVCGKAGKHGDVEICNAGHIPPLLLTGNGVKRISATGLPLGMFCGEEFSAERFRLAAGDRILLATDGLSEAKNSLGVEFGMQSLVEFAQASRSLPAAELLRSLLSVSAKFQSGPAAMDDLTLMALEFVGQ
jgi:sigma-B regulation protein RsbU (phosphoserine phosphatase)